MTTPDSYQCGCDPGAPVCACLPLWVQSATDDTEEQEQGGSE